VKLIVCTYRKWSDATGLETPTALVAHCEQFGDALCVIWHDATIADMARLGFDAEEYVGAIEAVEERFWQSEEESCRLAGVRQRAERRVA
jgi:hypothetical protein